MAGITGNQSREPAQRSHAQGGAWALTTATRLTDGQHGFCRHAVCQKIIHITGATADGVSTSICQSRLHTYAAPGIAHGCHILEYRAPGGRQAS